MNQWGLLIDLVCLPLDLCKVPIGVQNMGLSLAELAGFVISWDYWVRGETRLRIAELTP